MKTKPLFDQIKESMREVIEIESGKKKPSAIYYLDPDAKEIRELLGVSQEDFASMIGISVHTLRSWEQKRREPEGPAKVLLSIAGQEPETIKRLVGTVRERAKVTRKKKVAGKKKTVKRKLVSA